MNSLLSLEEIAIAGKKLYTDIREKMEKSHMGEYAVIDVETGRYQVNPNRLVAVEAAEKEFGQKLFYIIQVGANKNPNINYSSRKDYAWNF